MIINHHVDIEHHDVDQIINQIDIDQGQPSY